MQELDLHLIHADSSTPQERLHFQQAQNYLQGQGVFVKSSSSPPPAPADPSGSDGLAICSAFTTASTPPPPPTLHASDLRRLSKAPHPTHLLKCPRCASLDTKFCYYNNYSLSQPRYFCKNCKRYWTAGGALRNVPVGGGLRKNKRSKLKLAAAAAEAEASAVAAVQQQQQYEGKPPSPVAGSMSSSSSTTTMVSGLPANFVGAVPPNFHSSSSVHLLRTSSAGENCGAATVDYSREDGVAAASAAVLHQNSHHMPHFYGEGHVQLPHFYSSFSTSLTTRNQQYGTSEDQHDGSYHDAVGYVNQLQLQAPPDGMISLDPEMGRNAGAGPNSGLVSNGSAFCMQVSTSCEGKENRGVKEEAGEIISTNPTYDWQLISENLFNGGATDQGFLALPGGSWPDFSQFHDPSGPG